MTDLSGLCALRAMALVSVRHALTVQFLAIRLDLSADAMAQPIEETRRAASAALARYLEAQASERSGSETNLRLYLKPVGEA